MPDYLYQLFIQFSSVYSLSHKEQFMCSRNIPNGKTYNADHKTINTSHTAATPQGCLQLEISLSLAHTQLTLLLFSCFGLGFVCAGRWLGVSQSTVESSLTGTHKHQNTSCQSRSPAQGGVWLHRGRAGQSDEKVTRRASAQPKGTQAGRPPNSPTNLMCVAPND